MAAELIKILSAGAGSFGFSLIYNLKRRLLWVAFVSSSLMAALFILLEKFNSDILLINFFCAVCAMVISEILARIEKVPSTVLLIPTLLPLVPGGFLYYTMYGVVTKNRAMIQNNAAATLKTGLGIAIGIVVVSILFSYGRNRIRGKSHFRH